MTAIQDDLILKEAEYTEEDAALIEALKTEMGQELPLEEESFLERPTLIRSDAEEFFLESAELIDSEILQQVDAEMRYLLRLDRRHELRLNLSRLEVAGNEALQTLGCLWEEARASGKTLTLVALKETMRALFVRRGFEACLEKAVEEETCSRPRPLQAERETFFRRFAGTRLPCPADKQPIVPVICYNRQAKGFNLCAGCAASICQETGGACQAKKDGLETPAISTPSNRIAASPSLEPTRNAIEHLEKMLSETDMTLLHSDQIEEEASAEMTNFLTCMETLADTAHAGPASGEFLLSRAERLELE